MHLSKLIKVLQSFNRHRLTRLKKYVHSPYFPVYPPSLTLFNYLVPLHPRFLPKKIEPGAIAAKNKNLRTLHQQVTAGVRLLRTIEKFMAQEEWQKNEAEINRYKLMGFAELQLNDELEKGLEKEMKRLNKCPDQNIDTFFERHAITELSFNGFKAKLNRTAQNDIMPVVNTLAEYYAIKTLRYLCEAFNRQRVLGVNYHHEQKQQLLKILEPYNRSQYPYVYLFVNVFKMMEADDYNDSHLHYSLIKQFISLNGLTPTTREVATYAINQTLHWLNKGHDEAGAEYLWWIEWKMENKLLFEKGKLMPVTFRNIISAAQCQNNAPLLDKLIKQYGQHLPDRDYEANFCFATALGHYTQKNYKEAIRFFLMADAKEEVVFNCLIRLWHYRCLYEYDRIDTDPLYNHLTSFEKFLFRNKRKLQHRAGTFDLFIDYSQKLLKAEDKETLHLYYTELQNNKHCAGKQWLLQQFAAKNKKPVQVLHR